jgi:hypothetical protein
MHSPIVATAIGPVSEAKGGPRQMNMTSADLFVRSGQALCGSGSKWKEQLAAMLLVQTNTVDNWSKGFSRIPPGVWLELARYIQDRREMLAPLHAAVLLAADPPAPKTEMRIGPAIIGAEVSRQSIDELNRRLRALPQGHEFEGAILSPAPVGAMTAVVPRILSIEAKEGLKAWVAGQVRAIGSFTINPYRTTNMSNS